MVPTYIAYGLLEMLVPWQNYAGDYSAAGGKGVITGMEVFNSLPDELGSKDKIHLLGPQEQEFNQQMLRKLALHLAAQPDATAQPAEQVSQTPPRENRSSPVCPVEDELDKPSIGHSTAEKTSKGFNGICRDVKQPSALGRQESEFHQQMLRKLALHLAAQPSSEEDAMYPNQGLLRGEGNGERDEEASPGARGGGLNSPDGFATPPSAYACTARPSSTSQCVRVPSYIVQGLLERIEEEDVTTPKSNLADDRGCRGIRGNRDREAARHVLRPQEQEFHQQMLRKMALHLAAQPTAEADSQQQQQQRPQLYSSPRASPGIVVPESTGAPCEKAGAVGQKPRSKEQRRNLTPLNGSHPQEFHPEILRKLALHLAAQPDSTEDSPQAPWPQKASCLQDTVGASPEEVGNDKELCDRLIMELESCGADAAKTAKAQDILAWIRSLARPLALTQSGTRVVQIAIDVASLEQRESLVNALLLQDRDMKQL
jgi:hypothetical protein